MINQLKDGPKQPCRAPIAHTTASTRWARDGVVELSAPARPVARAGEMCQHGFNNLAGATKFPPSFAQKQRLNRHLGS